MRVFPLERFPARRTLRTDGITQWLATEPRTEPAPALLKRLLPHHFDDPALRARWLVLAARNAALAHASCTRVLAWGEAEGAAYVALAAPQGIALEQLGRAHKGVRRRLAAGVALHLVAPLLEALGGAHAREEPLVHGELSAASIVVTRDGRPMLTEFGSLAALSPERAARIRLDRGSVHFSAPEQVRGGPSDARSDLFSIGGVLFELLAGERPFGGATQAMISLQIASGARKRLDELVAYLSPDLTDFVEVLLAPEPDDRFASAEAALAALRQIVPEDPEAAATVARLFRESAPAETAILGTSDPRAALATPLGPPPVPAPIRRRSEEATRLSHAALGSLHASTRDEEAPTHELARLRPPARPLQRDPALAGPRSARPPPLPAPRARITEVIDEEERAPRPPLPPARKLDAITRALPFPTVIFPSGDAASESLPLPPPLLGAPQELPPTAGLPPSPFLSAPPAQLDASAPARSNALVSLVSALAPAGLLRSVREATGTALRMPIAADDRWRDPSLTLFEPKRPALLPPLREPRRLERALRAALALLVCMTALTGVYFVYCLAR